MKLLIFSTILCWFIIDSATSISFGQPETEKYIWPIDDPSFYPGTNGAPGNPISATVGEYRPEDSDDDDPPEHFHAGVDMPSGAGLSVWYQSDLLRSDGLSSYAKVLTVGTISLVTENKWVGYENVPGFKYVHVSTIQVSKDDRIVDGPAYGITGRYLNPNDGIWRYPRQLEIGEIESIDGPHLHFEDRFGNPLDINIADAGLNPYSDSQQPVINGIKVYVDGTNTRIERGAGTSDDPYVTNGATSLDLLVDLYDPTNHPNARTMPYLISCFTYRANDPEPRPLVDDHTIEFEYYTQAELTNEGHYKGISYVYGSGTSINPTVFKVFVTNDFSHGNGGAGNFIQNILPNTAYYTDVWLYDQGSKQRQGRVYFVTSNPPVGVEDHAESLLPAEYRLLQNFPNPFNPSTTIRFALPKKSLVSLAVFNVHGSLVRELITQKFYEPGWGELVWDGANAAGLPVASGAYFYRLNAESLENGKRFSQTKKLLLVR